MSTFVGKCPCIACLWSGTTVDGVHDCCFVAADLEDVWTLSKPFEQKSMERLFSCSFPLIGGLKTCATAEDFNEYITFLISLHSFSCILKLCSRRWTSSHLQFSALILPTPLLQSSITEKGRKGLKDFRMGSAGFSSPSFTAWEFSLKNLILSNF